MVVTRSTDFRPAWWLPGPHTQTLWSVLCRRRPRLILQRQQLELSDGDFLDLDWLPGGRGPIVLILHGLEGSSASHYACGLLAAIAQRGWRALVMHFRGCSGKPNRLARSYCAADTADVAQLVNWLRQREPDTPLAAVGYSLGGNVLLKWLGESKTDNPLRAAIAVSVPFLLDTTARRLNQGFSRLYQAYLLRALKRSYQNKFQSHPNPPVPLDELATLRDFLGFDDRITAPLHGFANVHDYYAQASCRPYLRHIHVPTLILHALDDPFMLPAVVPDASELASCVHMELCPHGGHVGFVAGRWPWRAEYWLERRIPEFLATRWYESGIPPINTATPNFNSPP